MNRLRLYLLALAALTVCSVKADEGMWLLQLMQQQTLHRHDEKTRIETGSDRTYIIPMESH